MQACHNVQARSKAHVACDDGAVLTALTAWGRQQSIGLVWATQQPLKQILCRLSLLEIVDVGCADAHSGEVAVEGHAVALTAQRIVSTRWCQ